MISTVVVMVKWLHVTDTEEAIQRTTVGLACTHQLLLCQLPSADTFLVF